jgi:hypothetical protein
VQPETYQTMGGISAPPEVEVAPDAGAAPSQDPVTPAPPPSGPLAPAPSE